MASCVANVAPEQLCYIPCNFCNIVLAVSVPCSNLFDIVTVRCGHCTNLWSVNMAAAFQSISWQDVQMLSAAPEYRIDTGGSSSKCNNKIAIRSHQPMITTNTKPVPNERTVNRPPEKRQRVPSAYNQFIKEEIQRIKANNPNITHREAFSTAAKNVYETHSMPKTIAFNKSKKKIFISSTTKTKIPFSNFLLVMYFCWRI